MAKRRKVSEIVREIKKKEKEKGLSKEEIEKIFNDQSLKKVKLIKEGGFTPLDRFRFKSMILGFGSLVWNVLVLFSTIILVLFILITCLVYWENLSITLFLNNINILNQVSIMFLIVFIALLIFVINKVKGLTIGKKQNGKEIKEETKGIK